MSIFILPVETVEQILEELGYSKDILHFAQASRRCLQLAYPCLYRKLSLVISAANASSNELTRRTLLANPQLCEFPRSLRLSQKKYPPASDSLLPCNWTANRESPLLAHSNILGCFRDPGFEATFESTNSIMALLPRFSTLQELTLRSMTLPKTFYQIIHSLSDMSLRRLVVRACRLSSRYPQGYNPANLQLEELTLIQVAQGARTSKGKIKAIMKLARSPYLTYLKLDQSVERALESYGAYGVPPSLHTLVVDFRSPSVRPDRGALMQLFKFMGKCYHVKDLQITDMGKLDGIIDVPGHMRLQPEALPTLSSITAPLAYLGLFVMGRPIKSISVLDVLVNYPPIVKHLKMDDIADTLIMLKTAKITLETIQFNIKEWDKEIIYMLSEMSPNIKEINIAYASGQPDDNFFMTLGNIIEFPKLERLHLYRLNDKMARSPESDFQDHKEYVIIWQRHMPNLREVALAADVVWIRGQGKKAGWMRTNVAQMRGVDNLVSQDTFTVNNASSKAVTFIWTAG
ncbi:hypothetical protein SCHPADRAFT_852241 [Schizopora paradoxa]|uniref:F-box domain-containing protein n=1 Tax=Schizopora paradoxa TaxID=27342 RepID=A0A0H2RPX2_9AGAM|nr:hypothetical protein SCHPADRAFT_852241 [Schizopora paradoxa]